MTNRTTTDQRGTVFTRVSKTAARAAYLNGETVYICPVNIRPFSAWFLAQKMNRRGREQFILDEIGARNDFNNLVGSYEHYNCTCPQTGKYAAFYMQEARP